MSILESVNLIISSLEKIIYSKSKKKCRTFICNMGKPIKINDLARKMLFLSGRDPNKNISKKYYGLSKASEKISEKLISKNERIINANTNSVFEISTNYRIMKISDINSLIKNNLSNIEFIKKLKKKV